MSKKAWAIPIRCVDYSNSSQVVTLFSDRTGLVEGIAKGAHRPNSSFQGPFDLAVLYDVVFLERRSSGLVLLTESTVLDGFRGLRTSWARYLAASHVIEFLRTVITSGEEAGPLFALVLRTFHDLATYDESELSSVLLSFDLQALRLLGLLPPVRACVKCGRLWPESQSAAFFSPCAGGLVCRTCRQSSPELSTRRLAGGAIRLLQYLSESEEARPVAELESDWQLHRRLITSTIHEMRNHLLERELTVLKSRTYLG